MCILNDSLQGTAVGLGFVLGGTPEFLLDTRRGPYSYPALQSRLAQNTFATNGLVDFSGPVVRPSSLTPEDLYVLLQKIRGVYAFGDPAKHLLPDNGVMSFMEHCSKRVGDAYFRTPRTTITAFINLLAVLEQNAFEAFCCLLWAKQGFQATVTAKRGGDGGIDVVALKGNEGALLQCESSKSAEVGWDAVKEVVAGAARYQARLKGTRSRRLAVTNQQFNRGAIEQAEANRVSLVTRPRIEELRGSRSRSSGCAAEARRAEMLLL